MIRLSLFAAAILAIAGSTAQASDPLDCMPDSARIVMVVDNPRKLAETITGLAAFKEAQILPQVRQIYDSPTAQRLYKLLAFAEKELGAQWPNLLDQIAGNGIALGGQFQEGLGSAIAIASGTDSVQVGKAFDLAMKMLDEEFTRQGGRDVVRIERNDGITFAHLGADFHFARVDKTILAANNLDFLKEAVALARTKPQGERKVYKARRDAAKLLPKNPLGWIWLNMASFKESKATKDFFDATRQDFLQTLVVGSTIDCLRRSDFIAVGLYQESSGFRLRARLPAGREGLWSDLALHVPPKGSIGSLALLEPPGTIYSQSFHLDIGYMWKNRERMISAENRKGFEKGEKQLSRFLPSDMKLGDLLEKWGPQHRIVVANHDQRPYKTVPELKLPAFGYVATMRDKKFGDNLAAIFQGISLIGMLTYGLKTVEVQHEGITINGYRFDEGKTVPDDSQGDRFNFEPCFAIVGDEMMMASTIELGKKLITELKKPRQSGSAAVWKSRVSAASGADTLAGLTDPLITDAVLGRGVGLTEARKEIADLIAFVRTLGTAQIEIDITATEYRLDLVWTPGK
ncbi:MAG TPA: hypothetical protein VG097_16640 [Gemmata sp.]|jgi:hypothetical protein|nr:hypothetical protein [Gemmata sp.]